MVFKNGAFIFSGEELLTALRKINYARERKSDSVFSGIAISINISDIEFIASNRHRAAIYSVELDYESDDIYDDLTDKIYLLSKETVKQLLKIKKNETVYMTIYDDTVEFKTENMKIIDYSEGIYPYYREAIPKEYHNETVVYKKDLLDVLNDFRDVPTVRRSKEVGNYTYFKLTFDNKNDCLIITPYLHDLFKIEPKKIEIKASSFYDETVEIYINNVYLKEAVSHVSNSLVEFRYNDSSTPIEISSNMKHEDPYKAYIMPAVLE